MAVFLSSLTFMSLKINTQIVYVFKVITFKVIFIFFKMIL